MKRFYDKATAKPVDGGFQVHLDDRPMKTALGNPQIVRGMALAEALAKEWDGQGETIDPARFLLRDLADFAIDMVGPDPSETIAKLLSYLETDTLCYRADPDEPFFRRQLEVWDPLLAAFEAREGVRLERVSGIVHRPHPKQTAQTIKARLHAMDGFTLTALLTMTSLAASLSIGLTALEDDADVDALWAAANLEEDWQIEQWGADYEAEAVRARRTRDFLNAWKFSQLAHN